MINYTPPTQHTSLFYNSEEEYLDIILPFIKAGLENNEFCLWIIPKELSIEDAHHYLRQSVDSTDLYLQKSQLSIRDYESFYLQDGVFSGEKVLQGFVDLERKVLADGFKGIRVTGDGSWALGDNWFGLMTYEREINQVIQAYKIRALCSYHIPKLRFEDIYNIGINHQSSLVKQMGSWNRLDTSKFAQAKID